MGEENRLLNIILQQVLGLHLVLLVSSQDSLCLSIEFTSCQLALDHTSIP